MISGGDIELGMQSTIIPMNIAHEDEAQSELPPGFRFHPTDEELVTHYLTKKILDSTFSGRAIGEADLNKCEPWDLLEKAKMGEKEWYFFGLRDRKFTRGLRINRTTEAGYWKTTGKDREVLSSVSSALIGMKKTLVFLKGRAPKGEKTNWVMHEYRLEGKFSDHHLPKNCKLDDWVVCRIFEKSAGGRSSTGLMRRNAYLDLPASPSLPTLLKSPCNKTAVNDQETRSSESDSGTSAKIHDVSFFSKLMEPVANLTGHHLHQFQCGSSSSYADTSDQLSEVGRLMKHSSYMHNDLNDPRTYMNMIPTATPSSVSNMGCDQISVILDKQPGIQQLPGLPSIIYNPHMPLPSNSSNLGFTTDAYFSALHPSDAVSKGLVSQFTLRATEPSFISCVHHSVGVSNNNNSMGLNNSVHNFQWGEDFSGDMNDEMTYALCSRLD